MAIYEKMVPKSLGGAIAPPNTVKLRPCANGLEIFENVRRAFRTFHAEFSSLHASPNFRHGCHTEFLSSHATPTDA